MEERGRQSATRLSKLLGQYKWLLDSYVIEFFTEAHWSKLPESWRDALTNVDLKEISHLLLSGKSPNTDCKLSRVYPLSLLAFASTAHALTLPRTQVQPDTAPKLATLKSEDLGRACCDTEEGGESSSAAQGLTVGLKHRAGVSRSQIEGLDHSFRRHVKPKKQHEIKLLAEVVYRLSRETSCNHVIDIGSGQGHLARCLAYQYGLQVTAVEAVGCHLSTAAKFDKEVEKDMDKKNKQRSSAGAVREEEQGGCVTHVEALIHPEVSVDDLLKQLSLSSKPEAHLSTKLCDHPEASASNSTKSHTSAPSPSQLLLPDSHLPFSDEGLGDLGDSISSSKQNAFILVGLHTCGDLGPTMVRVFAQSHQLVGLVSVGCCYMKLTCPSQPEISSSTITIAEISSPTVAIVDKCQPAVLNLTVQPPRDKDSQSQILQYTSSHQSDVAATQLSSFQSQQASLCCSKQADYTSMMPLQADTENVMQEHMVTTSAGVCLGYPTSEFVKSLPHHSLSYAAREVACHSIESYLEKIQADAVNLKVHCHRAAVETILRKHGLRRCQVKISKRVSKLPFQDYAKALLQSVNLPTDMIENTHVVPVATLEGLVAQWREVVVFFTLRLALAPCVESLLLLDRALYLREQGCKDVSLVALFDPKLSPRNLVLVAKQTIVI